LVDKEYAVEVSGWAESTIDPYLYRVTMIAHPKRKPEQVIAALDAEIKKLQDVLTSKDELKRAVKQARAVFVYGNENITNQAFWMGYVEMFSSYEWFTTYLDNLAKVTPQDIQRVAQKYFQPASRVIGIYVPKGNEA
jgi:zinc protease